MSGDAPGSGAWRSHFAERHREAQSEGLARSLDYSNDRVRTQTYAHLLEGLGSLEERDLLDAGCGWGSLALTLHACGARVTAIDFVPRTVAGLAERYPFIDWRVADLTDPQAMAELPEFDGIVAAEVLQYVEFEPGVEALWRRLRPGGRLLGSVPNAECPIARRVAERSGGSWGPVSEKRILALGERLPGVEAVWLNGLSFRREQGFLPYRASGWGERLDGVPNRILFALVRAAAG